MIRGCFRAVLLAIIPAVLADGRAWRKVWSRKRKALRLMRRAKSSRPASRRLRVIITRSRSPSWIRPVICCPTRQPMAPPATPASRHNRKRKPPRFSAARPRNCTTASTRQVNRAPEWMGYFPIPGGYPIMRAGRSCRSAWARARRGFPAAVTKIVRKTPSGPSWATANPRRHPRRSRCSATTKFITMDGARKLVDACLAFADRNKFGPLGISVVDPDGTLLSFQGTRGASKTILETAELKAVTAAHWRRTHRRALESRQQAGQPRAGMASRFPAAGRVSDLHRK